MALNVLRMTEKACNYVASSSLSAAGYNNIPVFNGISNSDKSGPCVICYAESANEDFPNSGIYRVVGNVIVKELAADTDVSSSVADTIFQGFLNDNIVGTLNSYSGAYYVYGFFVDGVNDEIDEDTWIQQYKFEIVSALTWKSFLL